MKPATQFVTMVMGPGCNLSLCEVEMKPGVQSVTIVMGPGSPDFYYWERTINLPTDVLR